MRHPDADLQTGYNTLKTTEKKSIHLRVRNLGRECSLLAESPIARYEKGKNPQHKSYQW